jgi:hypothetical protein
MNTYSGVRTSSPAGLFSFGLLDGLHVRLRRPHLREAPAGFGLKRLATAFMNNPGQPSVEKDRLLRSRIAPRLSLMSTLREHSSCRDPPKTMSMGRIVCRMRKQAVQQGRSNAKRGGVPLRYVEPLSDARTPLAGCFRILRYR